MSREFGIYPDGFNPRQWWGARALIERYDGEWRFVLLPDRQNYERNETVTDTDRADFFCWMENEMDKALQERVRVDYEFRKKDVLFVLDSQSGRFHCEARARNSGGYLYIGAWEITAKEIIKKEFNENPCEYRDEDGLCGACAWMCECGLPSLCEVRKEGDKT